MKGGVFEIVGEEGGCGVKVYNEPHMGDKDIQEDEDGGGESRGKESFESGTHASEASDGTK